MRIRKWWNLVGVVTGLSLVGTIASGLLGAAVPVRFAIVEQRPKALLSGAEGCRDAACDAADCLIGPSHGEVVTQGRKLFLHNWTMNDAQTLDGGDGLGPVCNANSCSTCHFKGGVGDHSDVMEELGLSTPPLFGVGLIDGVGSFGWRGQFKTLRDFVGTAAAVELGLSNELRRQDLPGRGAPDESAGRDLSFQQLDALVAYCRSLPRPRQIMPIELESRADVESGEGLFTNFGCARCHIPDFGGVVGIYSDFRLHYLVDTSYDSDEEYYGGKGFESVVSWKTPPLWGVADSGPYMHDGSAATLLKAIAAHGSEGASSRRRFDETGQRSRDQLIAFLESLRAPLVAEPCPPGLRGNLHIAPGGLMCY